MRRADRHDALRHAQPDFAPLVDQPRRYELVGLIDVAVEQLEGESLGSRRLQQAPRLGARFLDVWPVARQRLELGAGGRQRRAGKYDAAHRVHVGDFGQRRRATPLVDGERQRPPDPRVVERLLLVVGRDHVAAVPVAALHHDLVAQLALELIARRRWQAADRIDADRLLGRIDADEAVEIRLPGVIIVGIAHPLDRLAGLVTGELERAGTHDVHFVPARILVEDGLLVDPRVGLGERRQERAGRKLQAERHGGRVGRLDAVDHQVMALARTGQALGRVDDLAPARRHVGGGERRAVVKPHALADLEGIGPAGVGRRRHLGAQIADEVRGRGRIIGIGPDEHAVERCRRMHRGERGFSQPGRTVEQDVRQRLFQLFAGVEHNAQPPHNRLLADDFAEPARPQGVVTATFFFGRFTAPHDGFTGHSLSFAREHRQRPPCSPTCRFPG